MKLRHKIKLLLVFVLSIAMMVPTLFVILGIRREAQEESRLIRAEEEEKLRSTLENLVEAAQTNVAGQYIELTTRKYQEQNYGVVARDFINQLGGQLSARMKRVKDGKLSLAEARNWTLEELRSIRFGGEEGYIWVQDLGSPTPLVIMHPTLPEFDGVATDVPRLHTAENSGEHVFAAASRIASSSPGGGYFDYLISRTYSDGRRLERVPKLSFVKYLPEWNWVIGTGVPLDRIIEEGLAFILEDIRKIRFLHGAGSFWICNQQGTILCSANPTLEGHAAASDPAHPFVGKALEAIKGKDSAFFELPVVNPLSGRSDRHLFHVRLFEPLGWIIGTSMNAASIDSEAQWELEKAEKKVWTICLSLFAFMIVLILISMRLVTGILQQYGVFALEENGPTATTTIAIRPIPTQETPVIPSPEPHPVKPAKENGQSRKKK